MLNYNKIASDLNRQNVALTVIARLIGVPYTSLKDRYAKQKLYADEIEIIADYFGRTISYYFDREEKQQPKELKAEEVINKVEEPCACCDKIKAELNQLKEKLIDKQEIIDALREANSALRGGVKKENGTSTSAQAG